MGPNSVPLSLARPPSAPGPRRVRLAGALFLAGILALALAAQCQALGRAKPKSPRQAAALSALAKETLGEIVFASRREGPWRLFRILPHGQGLVRLSAGQYNDQNPQFIQKGRFLVFESDRSGQRQVWRAEPENLRGASLLSKPGRAEWLHGASEDGSRILVRLGQGLISGLGDYRLRFADQSEAVLDFSLLDFKKGHMHALLAPSGRLVAGLWRPRGGGQARGGVWLMDLSPGGELQNPRWLAGDRCCVGWRPDSRAFLSCKGGVPGGSEIWLVDLAGDERLVRTGQDWDYWPAFGPRGRWMVWAAAPYRQHDQNSGDYDLFLLKLAGGRPVRLTFNTAPDLSPTWRAQLGSYPADAPERLYEGESYARPPAKALLRRGASGGRALALAAGQGPGTVFFGQYDHLPAGRWLAEFRLAWEPGQSREPAAVLEVAANGGRLILARLELRPSGQGGGFASHGLEFELARPVHDLECRLWASGRVGLWLDFAAIRRRPPGPLQYLWGLLKDTVLKW